MADRTWQGILVVADISGYTAFVRQHAPSAGHARQITARLLRAIVGASKPPLLVAELEGDAVFFYALASEAELPALAGQVKGQIPTLFRAFANEIKVLSALPSCSCQACSGIAGLRLKQVVHTGEVAVERMGPFKKLFGLAVIIVHRMLKNEVPAREYLMFSEAAFSSFGDFFGLAPERRLVELDGVGQYQMMVFYPDQLAALQRADESIRDPSKLEILRRRIGLRVRTVLDRIKRPHGPIKAGCWLPR